MKKFNDEDFSNYLALNGAISKYGSLDKMREVIEQDIKDPNMRIEQLLMVDGLELFKGSAKYKAVKAFLKDGRDFVDISILHDKPISYLGDTFHATRRQDMEGNIIGYGYLLCTIKDDFSDGRAYNVPKEYFWHFIKGVISDIYDYSMEDINGVSKINMRRINDLSLLLNALSKLNEEYEIEVA